MIDDVHRADAVTLGWLDHLTRRPHELAVLVLATRPLDAERVPATDVLDAFIISTWRRPASSSAPTGPTSSSAAPVATRCFLVELAASARRGPGIDPRRR